MLTFEYFKVFIIIFHFTGHAPISTFNTNPNNYSRLTIVVVFSSLAISLTMLLLFIPHFSAFGPIHNVINLSSLISSSLVILTANWGYWFHKDIYKKVVQRTKQIEKFLNEEFAPKQIQLISHVYKRNAVLIFVLFFVSQSLVNGESWFLTGSNNLISSGFTSLLRSMHPIAVLHFMLYSDTVKVFIQKLNQKIQDSPRCLHSTSKIDFLRNIKLMHLDLWKLVKNINTYFGWNLVFVIIHSFIYIQQQLYWLFLSVQVKFSWLGIIEGTVSFWYGTVSLSLLINSSKSSSLETKYLVENIQQYAFWSIDNIQLYNLKKDVLSQITHLPILITASDFFTIDRKLLAAIVASSCMYIIIFIQFFLSAEKD